VPSRSFGVSGAGDEVRTRDIQLGRLTLCQLSYSRPAAMVAQVCVRATGLRSISRRAPPGDSPLATRRGLGLNVFGCSWVLTRSWAGFTIARNRLRWVAAREERPLRWVTGNAS
jgi:hypothetical protein